MKKIIVLVFAWMFIFTTAFAEDTASATSSPSGKWFLQLQGGIGLPINTGTTFGSNTVTYNFDFYSLGFGGEAQVGYALSKDFSLSIEGGYENYPFTTSSTSLLGFFNSMLALESLPAISASLSHIPIELVAQYNIPTGSSISPYILMGAGVAFDSISYSNVPAEAATFFPNFSNTNFELDPGLGIAFAVSDNVNVFVQGKLAMDFAPNTPDNVNMKIGNAETFGLNIESGFKNGVTPIIIIPIQAGINFAFQ